MGGTDGNERKGIKIGINRCDSGNHDAETYYSTQRTSAESDLDDWIKLVPNEASVIYSQIAIKNHLKGVLRTFDTSYGINRRIEGDLGGFAIVLFGDALEVLGHERKVLEYFKLNADEYEFEDIYEQKESECTVEVTFRLYLCSSDYAVQIVKILKKENE